MTGPNDTDLGLDVLRAVHVEGSIYSPPNTLTDQGELHEWFEEYLRRKLDQCPPELSYLEFFPIHAAGRFRVIASRLCQGLSSTSHVSLQGIAESLEDQDVTP